MNVKKLSYALALGSCAWAQAAIADEFQKVRCDADIPKAMIGQRAGHEPVVAIEKKYQSLGLKDFGGDEISDRLSTVNWQICGAEYIELIDRGGRVRDVLAFPPHSKRSPAFSGILCELKGRELPDVLIAVLDDASATDPLPVQIAWKIDQQHAKFVKMSTEGLVCPRSGIYDGDAAP
jgi:hypothetical protein